MFYFYTNEFNTSGPFNTGVITGLVPLQEEIIRSIIDGKDTLGLRSLQVVGNPFAFRCRYGHARIMSAISPLIALMKDQEQQLRDKGIRAVAITSGMKKGSGTCFE